MTTDWGDYTGVAPDATMFARWVVVRKWPVGKMFIIRGFARCWTREGAERLAARWRRDWTEQVEYGARSQNPVTGRGPTVLVLDMRQHPGRDDLP